MVHIRIRNQRLLVRERRLTEGDRLKARVRAGSVTLNLLIRNRDRADTIQESSRSISCAVSSTPHLTIDWIAGLAEVSCR